jgi:hypothetical protein
MSELLKVALAVAGSITAGAIGYFFHEFQLRRKPFMFFREVNEVRKRDDAMEVPEHLISCLEPCTYVGKLYPTMKANDYYEVWDRADDVRHFASETIDLLTNIVVAASSAESKNAFKIYMSKSFGSKFLFKGLVFGNIAVPDSATAEVDAQLGIPVTFSQTRGTTCAMLHFDDQAYGLGRQMDDPTVRLRCEPFFRLLKRYHLDEVRSMFQGVKEALEAERRTVLQVIPELDKLKEDIGRWAIYCSISNLGTQPFAISTDGTASVKAKRIRPQPFAVYLTQEGKVLVAQGMIKTHQDCEGPLSLSPGESAAICWISELKEAEMHDGGVIRELYKNNEAAQISVRLRIIRHSLFGGSNMRSPWWTFAQEGNQKRASQ